MSDEKIEDVVYAVGYQLEDAIARLGDRLIEALGPKEPTCDITSADNDIVLAAMALVRAWDFGDLIEQELNLRLAVEAKQKLLEKK